MPRTVTTSEMLVEGLAADGINVYFGAYDICGNASLYYVPVGGGTATILYTSQFDAFMSAEGYVVAAGGAVYWADGNYGNLTGTAATNIMGIAAP